MSTGDPENQPDLDSGNNNKPAESLMRSQENSDGSDNDDYDNDIGSYYGYYGDEDEFQSGPISPPGTSGSAEAEDPETFHYETLGICDVERLLNESVEAICAKIPVTPALAKVLLLQHKWKLDEIVKRYRENFSELLIETRIKPKPSHKGSLTSSPVAVDSNTICSVCAVSSPPDCHRCLACGHLFCSHCWLAHFAFQLSMGMSTGVECMATDCHLLVPEDFAMSLLTSRPDLRSKYEQFAFQDLVKSHPSLRFCPGPNCNSVIFAQNPAAKKTLCKTCGTQFCFKCGIDYHAPTSCETIKHWLIKCADDSETANYITAHTKDCPKCQICIEKNGGCNHMQCYKCKHHFCWMCLQDWKQHGSEYYECSRYKENPNIATESVHVKAREALTKYLFYYERWENHNKSLKLEEQQFQRIKDRIDDKISRKEGTWIDWQYLYDAAALLTKCRYTLQYTYPYAYFMEPGPRKQLFEYQQAQMEREIENLSWKVERAESTQRGELENQMNIAEQKRKTLLKDFQS